MRISVITAISALGIILSVEPALAESCYDLWYERNSIYDANGYCFKTKLGRETFDNSDCYTKHPQFSEQEQWRIDQLKSEEENRGCQVN
jgi:hypothetical protein